jgi:hypothetical protein
MVNILVFVMNYFLTTTWVIMLILMRKTLG